MFTVLGHVHSNESCVFLTDYLLLLAVWSLDLCCSTS